MVIKYHVKKPIGFATLMLCFLLLACVSATLAAEEDHAVKAAPWMIAGAVAAFDDSDVKVKALALNKLMDINATAALKNRIAEIAKLLEHQNEQVRLSALLALSKMVMQQIPMPGTSFGRSSRKNICIIAPMR